MTLTDEQIEQAAKAMFWACYKRGDQTWAEVSDSVRLDYCLMAEVAAQFLQMPWEEFTCAEIEAVNHGYIESASYVAGIANSALRRRIAALLPKPVDPRREKIAKVLRVGLTDSQVNLATDQILAALDAKD